jgi:hypothetical protein
MELLKSLYEIHSPSGNEKKLKRFIKKWVADNIEGVECTWDNAGNVYFTKGISETYPVVVAHLDQVQKAHSKDFKAVITEDIVFGYSPSEKEYQGLGADDKNGLWIALKCLQTFDVIKVAFFVGEEIGCVGSSKCDMNFFADARFVVEPDRRGGNDLITEISGYDIASEAFLNAFDYASFGYKKTSGLMTDVLELTERGVGVACINMSCGYYNPHSDEEFTVISDLLNALDLVEHIITTCTDVYAHKATYSYGGYNGKWGRHYGYGYGYGYGADDDYCSGDFDWSDYERVEKDGTVYWRPKKEAPKTIKVIEPKLVKLGDFADVESFIDQLMFQNASNFFPEDLWQYVAGELDGIMTEDEFILSAYQTWAYYADLEDVEAFYRKEEDSEEDWKWQY